VGLEIYEINSESNPLVWKLAEGRMEEFEGTVRGEDDRGNSLRLARGRRLDPGGNGKENFAVEDCSMDQGSKGEKKSMSKALFST